MRVQRLLEAAERLLAQDGYAALTIVRLTTAARVPVGTFYQFFEDKDAIVEVLARRYVAEVSDLIANLVPETLELKPGSRLAAAFDGFVGLYAGNAAFRALRAARFTSAELGRAENANVDAAVDGVNRILTTGTHVPNGPASRSTARSLQLVADALLYRVFESGGAGDAALAAEAKTMLSALENDAIGRLRRRGRSAS